MLEESLDPRPLLPTDLARLLTTPAAPPLSTADLVRLWNDDATFWTNLRTLEHWIDRARR
jgi:hypothetical protein